MQDFLPIFPASVHCTTLAANTPPLYAQRMEKPSTCNVWADDKPRIIGLGNELAREMGIRGGVSTADALRLILNYAERKWAEEKKLQHGGKRG